MPQAKVAASNTAIIQAMANEGVFATDNRIPQNVADSIDSVQDRILNYQPTRNAFMAALLGQIVMTEIHTSIFRSPLGILKKSPMRYGATQQEIFVNMIKGHEFDPYAGVDVLYGYYVDQVMSAYHTLTPPIQYSSTFSYNELRTAFRDEYGVRDLIKAKVQVMYSSAQYDEYLNSKALVESAYNNGNVYAVTIPAALTKDNAEDFTIKIKSMISMMRFPNPAWNLAGATSTSFDNSIFYMTTPEYDSYLDVKVLATAYHDSKVSVDAQKIIVDKFANPHIKACLFDLRWFNIRDNYNTLSSSENGASNSWNFFLTNSEMFSYSPFFTMIVFTDEEVTVTGITADDTQVARGQTGEIKYTVAGGGYTPREVDYSISGNNSTHTFMLPGSNVIKIGADETSKAVTVRITSRIDPSISGTATVTVS